MMGLLLVGASFGMTTLFADAAQAQSQKNRQSQMGKPVSAAKPSVNRSKPNGAGSARPSSNKAAYNDRSGANGNKNRNAQNRNAQNRNAQNGVNKNGNRGGQTRPGQKGYRGPDNVVVVNGNPGNGYYDNGRYYNNNNYDRYDDDDDDFLEFVGKTAAITAGVSVVSAVIGDVVQDKPSDDCQEQIQNGQVYLLCNGTWYTPAQAGGQEAYQVVAPPQSSSPPPIDR
jgi:hypothetical protein